MNRSQCSGGAIADGGFDVVAQFFGDLVDEDLDGAVFGDSEHVGCFHLAHGVSLAQVEIHFDLHDYSVSRVRRRYRTVHGCASCTTIFE